MGKKPSAVTRAAVWVAPGSGLVIKTRFKGLLLSKRLRSMMCGKPNASLSHFSTHRHRDRRQVAVWPSQDIGLKGAMRPVLGIETSCDETAAAVVDGEGRVLAEAVLSQLAEHSPFGGVVPEIAARSHLRYLPEQVRRTMAKAGVAFSDLGGVAATSGPGLIGGLIVGCQFGKGVAIANGLPFVAVNHLEAHALTARLPGLVEGGAPFPYLLFLLSGGHSQCIAVIGVGQYIRLGGTVDDAAGEAFDKVAKLLDLDWPGGPALERIAAQGNPSSYPFPRPMIRRPGCDLSFSGLKTAVAQTVVRMSPNLTHRAACGYCGKLSASGGRCSCRPGGARDGDDAGAFP